MSGSDLNALFLSTYLILTNNTTGEVLLLSVSQKGWRTWPKSHAGGSGAGIRNLRGWFWNVCFSQCCSDLKSLQTACVYVSLYIFRLTPLRYSLHTIKCSYFFSGMCWHAHPCSHIPMKISPIFISPRCPPQTLFLPGNHWYSSSDFLTILRVWLSYEP